MSAKRIILVLILALATLANVLWGFGIKLQPMQSQQQLAQAEPSVSFLPTQCPVKIVFDGDTLGCDFNGDGKAEGKSERVRLLGIDTPESSHSAKNKTGRDAPCSKEAKKMLLSWVQHKTLLLKFDRNPEDKYHRKLAFAYLPEEPLKSINQKLIEAGMAKTLFIGVNRLYESQFIKAETEAQKKQLGIWNTQQCSL